MPVVSQLIKAYLLSILSVSEKTNSHGLLPCWMHVKALDNNSHGVSEVLDSSHGQFPPNLSSSVPSYPFFSPSLSQYAEEMSKNL